MKRILTVRDLKAGQSFKWKKSPIGWTSGKMKVTRGPPGFGMPEGWDFFDIDVLDNEIELINGDD